MSYSFKKFQKTALIRLLGMDKYKEIITMFNDKNTDLSTKKFTKCFNGFYRVRRNDKWQKVYYDFFNKNRNNKNITFDEILDYMFNNTENNMIEASFCSKMLATINPNMPIWDQYVLRNLNIKVDGNTKEEKLIKTKEAYKKIIEEVNNKLKEKDIQESIADFRKFFPELEFSDVKILDFILWNDR